MRQNNLDIVIQARTGSTRFSGKPMKILIVIPTRSGSLEDLEKTEFVVDIDSRPIGNFPNVFFFRHLVCLVY